MPFRQTVCQQGTPTVRSVSGKLESGTFQPSSASKCPHFTETQLMAALAPSSASGPDRVSALVKADVNPPAV
jgi:hypothetical protein